MCAEISIDSYPWVRQESCVAYMFLHPLHGLFRLIGVTLAALRFSCWLKILMRLCANRHVDENLNGGSTCDIISKTTYLQCIANLRSNLNSGSTKTMLTHPSKAEVNGDSATSIEKQMPPLSGSVRCQRAEDENGAAQDLLLMREDVDVHLTVAVILHLQQVPEDPANTDIVLPHLCRCSLCRLSLRDYLGDIGADAAHLAFSMLAEAEDWTRWSAAGAKATESARRSLESHGVSFIYARDGVVCEEKSDYSVGDTDNSADPQELSR
jgi:hypothetical protein